MLCLSLEAIGTTVETTSHAVDRVLEVRGGEPEGDQVTRHVTRTQSINPMGHLKAGTRVIQINKINKFRKIIWNKHKKGCTLAPVL